MDRSGAFEVSGLAPGATGTVVELPYLSIDIVCPRSADFEVAVTIRSTWALAGQQGTYSGMAQRAPGQPFTIGIGQTWLFSGGSSGGSVFGAFHVGRDIQGRCATTGFLLAS